MLRLSNSSWLGNPGPLNVLGILPSSLTSSSSMPNSISVSCVALPVAAPPPQAGVQERRLDQSSFPLAELRLPPPSPACRLSPGMCYGHGRTTSTVRLSRSGRIHPYTARCPTPQILNTLINGFWTSATCILSLQRCSPVSFIWHRRRICCGGAESSLTAAGGRSGIAALGSQR